jgi:hypothetical protein
MEKNKEEKREGYKDLEELKNTGERNVLTWTEGKVGVRNDKMNKKKKYSSYRKILMVIHINEIIIPSIHLR